MNRQKRQRMFLSISVILGLLSSNVSAEIDVNLKNGNMSVSYTDLMVSGGGNDLYLTRTYNSRSGRKGWFGVGWGNYYETYISPESDGTAVAHEYGTGAETVFRPKGEVNASQAAKQIVEAMKKKAPMSKDVEDDLMKKLLGSDETRRFYASQYGVKGTMAKGTVLYTVEGSMQELHRLADGYKRIYRNEKYELFDNEGKMTKIVEKGGNTIDIKYDKGYVSSILDSMGKKMTFTWNADATVKEVTANGVNKATYKYVQDNLTEATNVTNATFVYVYDGNHNLKEIQYPDKTKATVTYDPSTQFATARTDRQGNTIEYVYGSDPKDPELHYWTILKKKDLLSGKTVEDRYEYEQKVRPDGSRYSYRIYTVIDGTKRETIYHEFNGYPMKIVEGDRTTTFDYNKDGLLEKKESKVGEKVIDYTKLAYNDKCKKINRVDTPQGWSAYDYDNNCNLREASNNLGRSVVMTYDRDRISAMIDNSKQEGQTRGGKNRVINFEYNAMNKPYIIKVGDNGKIEIAYDNNGEITEVKTVAMVNGKEQVIRGPASSLSQIAAVGADGERNEASKIAEEVSGVFEELLDMVRPAGVSLNL